jgi:hypothetical protein
MTVLAFAMGTRSVKEVLDTWACLPPIAKARLSVTLKADAMQ